MHLGALDSRPPVGSPWPMRIIALALFCAFSIVARGAEDTFKAGSFTFKKPASFAAKELPPGGMRAAQLEFAAPDKKGTAEAIFYFFGAGQGGGTQANVDRWLGSFQEPKDKIKSKVEKKKVGGTEVTYVEAEGTYMSGMPGAAKTPQAGSKLLGAILESPEGNVFVRMTGPAAAVKAADADFRKMIESAAK
jgi:hypothetical protein